MPRAWIEVRSQYRLHARSERLRCPDISHRAAWRACPDRHRVRGSRPIVLNASAVVAVGLGGGQLLPGVGASFVVATAASFLAGHYGAPVMLFALLLGMAMNFLGTNEQCRPGIEFTAREVLRVGVA